MPAYGPELVWCETAIRLEFGGKSRSVRRLLQPTRLTHFGRVHRSGPSPDTVSEFCRGPMQRRAVSVLQSPVAPKPCCDSSVKLRKFEKFWKAGNCGELYMPTAIRRL